MFDYLTINMSKPICDCYSTEDQYKEGYFWNLAISDNKPQTIYLVLGCKLCDTSIIIPQNKVGALFVFDKIENLRNNKTIEIDNSLSNVIQLKSKPRTKKPEVKKEETDGY